MATAGINQLIVFLRAPELGKVKTRLAAKIGAEQALEAYGSLLRALFCKLRACPDVVLRITPDDALNADLGPLPASWRRAPQGGGDLGARLERAVDAAFADGAAKVAVIGSDCPYLDDTDLKETWAQLGAHEAVLGPTYDGGYWLIGLRRPAPVVFRDIPWSTVQALGTTLLRMREAGLKTHLLRILEDVDGPEEWSRFLGAGGKDSPRE